MIRVEPIGGAQVLGEVGRLPDVAAGAEKVTVRTPEADEVIAVAPTVSTTGP